MWVPYLAACLCVTVRAFLSAVDRAIFQHSKENFVTLLLFNALFPFLCACMVAFLFGRLESSWYQLLFAPGVILSGLGMQLASYFFSRGYQRMHVRGVVFATKTADLVIPLVLLLCGQSFHVQNYVFACLSTLIFFPILQMARTKGQGIDHKVAFQVVSILSFQAAVNYFFGISSLAQSFGAFCALMVAILFWRTVLVFGALLFRRHHPLVWNLGAKLYGALWLRSFLAFLAQSAFFYSITRVGSAVAWPVLNAGPLLSCFAAHFLLQETMERKEKRVAGYFLLVSFLYLYWMQAHGKL